MREGSIVTLKQPLDQDDMNILKKYNLKRHPVMGENYMVDFLRPPINKPTVMKVCVVLVEFPEYEECRLDMDADTFVEVLPPDLNVEKLLSEVPEPAHVAF